MDCLLLQGIRCCKHGSVQPPQVEAESRKFGLCPEHQRESLKWVIFRDAILVSAALIVSAPLLMKRPATSAGAMVSASDYLAGSMCVSEACICKTSDVLQYVFCCHTPQLNIGMATNRPTMFIVIESDAGVVVRVVVDPCLRPPLPWMSSSDLVKGQCGWCQPLGAASPGLS